MLRPLDIIASGQLIGHGQRRGERILWPPGFRAAEQDGVFGAGCARGDGRIHPGAIGIQRGAKLWWQGLELGIGRAAPAQDARARVQFFGARPHQLRQPPLHQPAGEIHLENAILRLRKAEPEIHIRLRRRENMGHAMLIADNAHRG